MNLDRDSQTLEQACQPSRFFTSPVNKMPLWELPKSPQFRLFRAVISQGPPRGLSPSGYTSPWHLGSKSWSWFIIRRRIFIWGISLDQVFTRSSAGFVGKDRGLFLSLSYLRRGGFVCVLTEGLNGGETSRHVIINILLYGKGNVDMIMMIVRDCYGSMQSHVVIINVTAWEIMIFNIMMILKIVMRYFALFTNIILYE